MRFSTFVVNFVCVLVLCFISQTVVSQTLPDEVVLSYACRNKPLKAVLKDLDQKSGVRINFVERKIPSNSKITISAVNEQLSTILVSILKPRRCKYDIIGNQIVVSRDRLRDRDKNLTISGYITDKLSGEALVGANAYLYDKSKGTQSNEYGFYSLTMDKGIRRMYFSYLGYGQEIQEFTLQRDTVINIRLAPDAQLNEVIILDDVENQEEPQTVSESKLSIDRIQTSTSLGGEADVVRLVAMMPGVNSGADGLGGLNVRGGSADQNLVLLDGVPVYNAGHALGLFSIFNSNVIKNATLIKGNIPARYGGRLSSVLDVRTREGNTRKLSGDATLSALAAKATIEGPIGKNGSSYLISARRTFLDAWIKSLTSFQNEQNGDVGFSNYYFMDLNAKLSFKLNERHSLYINTFFGRDKFENEKTSIENEDNFLTTSETGLDWDWGNTLASLKWTTQFSNKSFGRLTAYYTRFGFNSFEFDSFRTADSVQTRRLYKAGYYESGIKDYSIKYDFDYLPNPSNTIRLGVGAVRHEFSPGLISVNNSDNVFTPDQDITEGDVEVLINEPQLLGYEYYGFLEDDISFGYGTTLNLGVHANYTTTESKSFLNLQPRVALLVKGDNTYFKIGVTRMSQFLHLVSSNGLGLPTDLWLPSTDDLQPETSWIGSAGLGYYNSSGFRFGAEVYYKIFDALTSYKEGGPPTISVGTNWETLLPIGEGRAYGIETNFDKIIGRTTWNLNYALSFSYRQFDDLNVDGREFPFRYDRRHSIKLGFFHKLTDNTEFVFNWNLSSGNPVTKPAGPIVDLGGQLQIVYDEKNGGILPTYHRVDFGFNFYNKYKWGRSKLAIGLYNAFNRSNPFYVDIESVPENPNRYQEVEYSILPIVPSIAYSVSF